MRLRSVFLIARREFFAYVTTVGFWLSVTLVPFFMTFGAMMPQILAAAKPPTHFAIIDQTGRYADIVRKAVSDARRADLRLLRRRKRINEVRLPLLQRGGPDRTRDRC